MDPLGKGKLFFPKKTQIFFTPNNPNSTEDSWSSRKIQTCKHPSIPLRAAWKQGGKPIEPSFLGNFEERDVRFPRSDQEIAGNIRKYQEKKVWYTGWYIWYILLLYIAREFRFFYFRQMEVLLFFKFTWKFPVSKCLHPSPICRETVETFPNRWTMCGFVRSESSHGGQ